MSNPAIVDLVLAVRDALKRLATKNGEAATIVAMLLCGKTQADIARMLADRDALSHATADQNVSRAVKTAWVALHEALQQTTLFARFVSRRADERRDHALIEAQSAARWSRTFVRHPTRQCELRDGPYAKVSRYVANRRSDESLRSRFAESMAKECQSWQSLDDIIVDARAELELAVHYGRFIDKKGSDTQDIPMCRESKGVCLWIRPELVLPNGHVQLDTPQFRRFLEDFVCFGEVAQLRQDFLSAFSEFTASRVGDRFWEAAS